MSNLFGNSEEKLNNMRYSDVRAAKGNAAVYEAKAALRKAKTHKRRKERFLHRLIRLINGLHSVNNELSGKKFVTHEQKRKKHREVFLDAMGPYWIAFVDMRETFWDFICKIGRDTAEIILFTVNLILKIWYYLGKVTDRLSDKIWDLLFYMDQNKKKLFMTFSSTLSAAAMVLIIISSVSAYEYSYYGRTLGTAKSKQEVYRTIEVLGDKLSEVSGANVNLNVSRDIEFKKVFGFNLDVDTSDEILTTLTYMKDLQATGYAIKIDGKVAVIMESEEMAKKILIDYRNYFAGDKTGVEYTNVSYKEAVSFDEEQVLLGDIWNEDDALRYLTTGSVEELEEGEIPHPLINIYSVETATYDVEVMFDKEYVENSSLYTDETQLISAGSYGTETVVATIERENGQEVSRTIISSVRTSNPINAVYYQGTKPIPESRGTGTFIWPFNTGSGIFVSAYFGERYGVEGVAEVHGGTDFAMDIGTHVFASDGGTVTYAGYGSGYGFEVEIDHGGLYQTIYAHLDELFVSSGDEVYQGQHIANSGNTGISTGPHLHFEVRYKGECVDGLAILGYY